MIDVSDGLARDVRRLAAASSVGLALDAVPVAAGATLDEALGGGEDYELVFSHPRPDALAAAFAAAGLRDAVAHRASCVERRRRARRCRASRCADVGWRH